MTEGLDWIARSGAKAKGRRPEYFDDPAVDRLYSLTLALAAELSATRERLDTVERLLESRGALAREDVEAYAPEKQAAKSVANPPALMSRGLCAGFNKILRRWKSLIRP